jgi:glycosyltransferase involved in cell wall biosynthesis
VTEIRGVAVVVPARDEEGGIAACLHSILFALDRLPAGLATAVTVVLDRCTDRTPQIVEALLAGRPDAAALEAGAPVAGSGVGARRDRGVRDALARLEPLPPAAVWVLNTDADTTVPPDWAVEHLRRAARGVAGVAGMVDLETPAPLSSSAARRHDELVRELVDGPRHGHVYGANLGVRGDAYLAVGGFPADGAGEDRGLWDALRAAGYALGRPSVLRVCTSARTTGRAAGGLADLLRELDESTREVS